MGDRFDNNGQRHERRRDRVIDETKIVLMEQFFQEDAKEVPHLPMRSRPAAVEYLRAYKPPKGGFK
jgi:hypothetical protein